jgi:hypothetical protein
VANDVFALAQGDRSAASMRKIDHSPNDQLKSGVAIKLARTNIRLKLGNLSQRGDPALQNQIVGSRHNWFRLIDTRLKPLPEGST